MLDRGGLAVRSRAGLGLGRLFMCHLCSNLGRRGRGEGHMLRFERVLARVLGGGVLCGGLLLYVLPL